MVGTVFNYTGAEQTYTVPSDVSTVWVRVEGAEGEDGSTGSGLTATSTGVGEPGGKVTGELSVTGGNTLYVYVGGGPGSTKFNGGAAGGSNAGATAGDGGDASDIRQGGNTTADQVAVAGGGAGGSVAAGSSEADTGVSGAGGADNGEDGTNASTTNTSQSGATGGTQTAGGNGTVGGAANGNDGSRLNGGAGVDVNLSGRVGASGGGGGGYYGGGSSGIDTNVSPDETSAAGSGAGSNFDDSLATAELNQRGQRTGDGVVEIIPHAQPPSNLSATSGGSDSIDLSWDAGNHLTDYEIYRSTTSGVTTSDTLAGTVAAGTTTFTDTGLSTNTTYFYAVRAINSETESSLSNEASATTGPAAPTNLVVTQGAEDQLDLSWDDASTTEDEFRVYRATASGSTTADYTQVATVTSTSEGSTGTTYTHTDTSLSDGEEYFYRVTAYDSGNALESDASNEDSAITVLPAATNLTVDAVRDTEFDISWTDNSDNEDSYEVHYKPTSAGSFTTDTGLAANTTSHTITGLRNGEQYDIKVRVVTEETTTDSSTIQDTTTLPDVAQPTLGNGVEDEVSVSWSDVINYGDYRLQIEETDTGSDWSSSDPGWAETTVGEATTSHTFTGREDGEEYRVRMRTETEHVNGAWTSDVTIVTKFPAASNLSGTVQSTTQVDLSWTDNSDNEDNFVVERREHFRTGTGPWKDIATLSANTTSYSDTSANINTKYDYKIRAETEHTTADSGTITKTTNDDGVITDQPPAEGWFIVVEDTQGAVYRPPIVGEPRLNPKLNGFPTVQVPVSRNTRWEDNKWERQPMRVYHDGERQPIEEVRDIRQEPDQTVIQGVGGTELRQQVSTDIVEKDAHTTAKDAISNNTSYTANVDNPDSTTTNNVLEQSADSKSEWDNNLLNGSPAADAIYETDNGFLQSRQTAYFIEAEDADTHIDDGEVIEQDSTRWSGGEVKKLEQVEQNNAFRKIEHTFTIDHKIPESRVEAQVRIQVPNTGNHGFEIRINGNAIEDIGKDTLTDNETEPDWFLATVSTGDTGDLAAGDHTLTFILQESSANNGTIYVDCMSLYDTTETPNFTENVSGGVITGPDLYPAANQVQTSDATTVKQVVGGKLESTYNNTLNSQEVAISNDSGANWLTSANSETVSGSFASGSTTIRARFTISGHDTNTGVSPKGRKATQTVDLYDLYANLDDTPLLANRSWDNDLKSILNDIADYGDFIWEIRYDGGFSIEWTQPGQRTNTIDPGLVDYSVTTDFSSIHRKAIIYGTHVPVTNEQFTSNHDTFVALNNDWMAETGETVTTTDESTQFDRGSDYELKPNAGEIKVLSTGAMSDATTYEIDYFRRIRGSFTSGAHDGTYETLVESIPAITTQRNADQAALSIVKNASTPITTATVTIRKPPTGLNLVEAIDVDELPTGESLEVWSVENKPRQTILRLGSREPIEETINRIQSRLASTSKKV